MLDAFWSNKRRPINERSQVHGFRPTLFLQAAAVISIGTTAAITWAQPVPDPHDPIALIDDAGAAAFHKKCAACHSIGGQGTGEDISFTLRVPESRLEQEIFNMEKFTGPLELEQIMDLIDLMKSTEAADRLKTAKEQIVTKGGTVAEAAASATAEIHAGGAAFAVSCATCHNISGQGALTGTDISFTVHWKDDEIKNSIKKMEKYTGALPPDKVQALTELLKRQDAAAQVKAAKGGAAVAQAPAAATAEAPSTATATAPAQTQSTATQIADAPAKTAAIEWVVTTATAPAQATATAPTPATTPSPQPAAPSPQVAEAPATPAAAEATAKTTEPRLDAHDPIALVDDAGAAAFHKKCAACHSIGGQGTGEDISFTLRVPESRLEQEIFNMEKFTGPLELEQIMDLIDLMKSTEAADRLKTAKEQIVTKGGTVAEAAASATADIHAGGAAFAESCATCHNISGQGALTGTDISFTVHWKDDEIKNSIKKMEKYTGALPPDKVQALTELLKRQDAAAQVKAAKGGAPVAQARAAATAEAPSTATATAPAQTQSTATQIADAPARSAATEWVVTTATQADEQKPTGPQVAAAEATSGDPMAELFANRCALCHTIGGGMKQGPDLAPTRNKGFPIVEAAVRRMQMQSGPLEEPQIKGLTELIMDGDFKNRVEDVLAARAAAAPPQQVAAAPKVKEADPEELGMELFQGDAPFARGGISCNACHSIGSLGGTAAPDLRFAHSKLGEEALLAIIRNTDGKAIHPIYNEHKITEAEAQNLVAYLKDTSEHPPRANPSGIPVWAILGAMLAIGLLGYLFRPFPENDDRTAL